MWKLHWTVSGDGFDDGGRLLSDSVFRVVLGAEFRFLARVCEKSIGPKSTPSLTMEVDYYLTRWSRSFRAVSSDFWCGYLETPLEFGPKSVLSLMVDVDYYLNHGSWSFRAMSSDSW